MLRKQQNNPKSRRYINRLAKKLHGEGYEDIRAATPDFESPSAFRSVDSGHQMVPDLTANFYGRKAFVDVAHKTESPERLAFKWRFLSQFAKIKNAVFKVVVPRGHMRFTRDLVDRHGLQLDIEQL